MGFTSEGILTPGSDMSVGSFTVAVLNTGFFERLWARGNSDS